MDKLAELVRDSEVRGAIAAFVDLGLVKVAGQEGFDALVDAVCQGIGDEAYDLQKVASLTEEILSELENEEQEKTAGFGAVIGADRVSNLSDGEKAALIRHYGLSNDAALGLRNAGRGQLGGIAGNLLGSAAGMADAARQNSPGECVITSGTSDCMRCKKIAKAGQVPAFFVSPVVVWGMAGLACAGA